MMRRNKAPEDGIVASTRPKGWAALRWMSTFDPLIDSHQAELARGRTLARSGRVRDLWFSPGLGSAEVVTNRHNHRVTVRVRVFEDLEWTRVVRQLLGHLEHIAVMLEGDLPEAFIEDLDRDGLPLLPALAEIDGVCDCGDFHMPCAHMAAVHNVIAEALDGDPFLLLTLRGLDRAQLLARLRRAWNDPHPLRTASLVEEQPPPDELDWASSPQPLPPLALHLKVNAQSRPGVYALGPAPGRSDLGSTLEPLYQAGVAAAADLALEDPPDNSNIAPFSLWESFRRGQTATTSAAPIRRAPDSPEASRRALTERLVDLLAELENAKSKELAARLSLPVLVVRQELLDLEKLGIVYRTGQTRGTRWWLG